MPASSAPQRSQYHSVGRLSVPHSPHLSVLATPAAPGLPGAVAGSRGRRDTAADASRRCPTARDCCARRDGAARPGGPASAPPRRHRLEERELVAGGAAVRDSGSRGGGCGVAPAPRAAAAPRRPARWPVRAPARRPPAGRGGRRRRRRGGGRGFGRAADQRLHFRQPRDLVAHRAQLAAEAARAARCSRSLIRRHSSSVYSPTACRTSASASSSSALPPLADRARPGCPCGARAPPRSSPRGRAAGRSPRGAAPRSRRAPWRARRAGALSPAESSRASHCSYWARCCSSAFDRACQYPGRFGHDEAFPLSRSRSCHLVGGEPRHPAEAAGRQENPGRVLQAFHPDAGRGQVRTPGHRAVIGQQHRVVAFEKRLDRIARGPASRWWRTAPAAPRPSAPRLPAARSPGMPSPATANAVAVGGCAWTTAPQSRPAPIDPKMQI